MDTPVQQTGELDSAVDVEEDGVAQYSVIYEVILSLEAGFPGSLGDMSHQDGGYLVLLVVLIV